MDFLHKYRTQISISFPKHIHSIYTYLSEDAAAPNEQQPEIPRDTETVVGIDDSGFMEWTNSFPFFYFFVGTRLPPGFDDFFSSLCSRHRARNGDENGVRTQASMEG